MNESRRPDERARVVLMTVPDAPTAERIVTDLVESRLAACGNIMEGVTSIYRWKGAVEREREVLVVLKTTAALAERLVSRAQELHPYEVPELLSLRVDAGCEPYIAWIEESTGREQN